MTVNGRDYRDSTAPLHEVGALLDGKAVDRGRSARNHLLALGAPWVSEPGAWTICWTPSV